MSRTSVLIVDDNLDLAETLKDGLEQEDCEVTTAATAEDAIVLFQAAHFDLTLLDVKLPGQYGTGCMIEMLKIKPDSRIVVMSGYRVGTLLEDSLCRGAVSVLQKPFSIEQVLELIESH